MRINGSKKALVCLLALLMLALLSACGGKQSNAAAGTRRSSTITVAGTTTESTDYTYTVLSGNTVRIDRIFNLPKEITIPEAVDGMTVTALGRDLLRSERIYLAGTITIPDCVTTLEGNPFDCEGWQWEIVVSSGHPTLEVVEGVLFSKPDHRLVCAFNRIPGSFDEPAEYAVPEGTEIIEDHAFRAATYSWGTIRIPNSVTTLGRNPFAFCNSANGYDGSLTISVAEDHPTLEIVDGMLFSKPDHRLVCFADPRAIMQGDGQQTRYEVPEGTEVIDDYAFSSQSGFNTRLETIRIPASVKTVGKNPFYCQGELKELELDPGNAALEYEGGLLYSKADQRLVACIDGSRNDYTVRAGTKTVGDYAFLRGHIEAWSVSLPDGLTEIGDRAFYGDVSCNIPASLQRIGCCAFNCYGSAGKQIDLVVDHDLELGAFAFGDLNGYSAIRSLTVTGDAKVDVHPSAFYMCRGLSKVRIEAGETRLADGAFSNSGLEEAVFGEGLLSIGSRTFEMCDQLNKLVLPASLLRIGDLNNKLENVYDAETDMYVLSYSCSAEVYVKPDSYAERYCLEAGIPCRYAD